MTRSFLLLVAFCGCLAVPAQASDECAPGQIDCGMSGGLFGEGLLGDLLRQVDPWLADLGEMLGDLSGWHAPEVLENGDILIRRRQTQPEPPETEEDDAPVTDPLEL